MSSFSYILTTFIASSLAANIALEDICGNKLVGSCPSKISLKVVGGDSSCAEKVPWNVLVELISGPKIKAAGNRSICLGGSLVVSASLNCSATELFKWKSLTTQQ